MITRKVVDSITREHSRKATHGNCKVCLLVDKVQVRTTYAKGNAWLCENHK